MDAYKYSFQKLGCSGYISITMTFFVMLFFILLRINSCIDAYTYEDLSVKSIKSIAFYKYIVDPRSNGNCKGDLLIMIDKKEEIKYFLENYWKKIDVDIGHSWGKKYFMVIEKVNGSFNFIIQNDKYNKYVKMLDADFYFSYSSKWGFKSDDLYKYTILLEKKVDEKGNKQVITSSPK